MANFMQASAAQQRHHHVYTSFELMYISQSVKGVIIGPTTIEADTEFRIRLDVHNRILYVYGRSKRYKMMNGERLELFTKKGLLTWRRCRRQRATAASASGSGAKTTAKHQQRKVLLENGVDREQFSALSRSYSLPANYRIALKYLSLCDRCSVRRILLSQVPSLSVELRDCAQLLCLPDRAEKVIFKVHGDGVCDGRVETSAAGSDVVGSSRRYSSKVLVLEAFLYDRATLKNISVTTQAMIRSFSPDVEVKHLKALDHCKINLKASSESFLQNVRIKQVRSLPPSPPSSSTMFSSSSTTTRRTTTTTGIRGGSAGPTYTVRSEIGRSLIASLRYTLPENEVLHLVQRISADQAASSTRYLHEDHSTSKDTTPPKKRLCGKLSHQDVVASEEQDKCVICLTNLPVVVAIPCGDVAYCFECAAGAANLKKCALCREDQQGVVMPKKTHSVIAAALPPPHRKRSSSSSSSSCEY